MKRRIMHFGLFIVCWLGLLLNPVKAQWTHVGADFAGRHRAWKDAITDPFSPTHAIGASSLAFGPNDTLFLACEKYPFVLIFPADGSKPRHVQLEGVPRSNGHPDVDLEAMSIHGGNIYLVDEDKLVVYVTPADNPGRVTTLEILDGNRRIDTRSTNHNPKDLSSIEGLVVSNSLYADTMWGVNIGAGPYFYLLDERDNVGGKMVAKIYLGTRDGDLLKLAPNSIAFNLDDNQGPFRMPELFERRGEGLYALKTRPSNDKTGREGKYIVVRCDLEKRDLKEVCDFSSFATHLGTMGFTNNFEGAAVAPDGRLFLTADNEMLEHGEDGFPPDGYRTTPIISLKVQP